MPGNLPHLIFVRQKHFEGLNTQVVWDVFCTPLKCQRSLGFFRLVQTFGWFAWGKDVRVSAEGDGSNIYSNKYMQSLANLNSKGYTIHLWLLKVCKTLNLRRNLKRQTGFIPTFGTCNENWIQHNQTTLPLSFAERNPWDNLRMFSQGNEYKWTRGWDKTLHFKLHYPPWNQHIPWKLMVGRWKFLLKWSLFRGHSFIFGGANLLETNSQAPENKPKLPPKKDISSSSKNWCSGANWLLVSGRVWSANSLLVIGTDVVESFPVFVGLQSIIGEIAFWLAKESFKCILTRALNKLRLAFMDGELFWKKISCDSLRW